MGYLKRIAVIKGIRGGFSADGGALSGLVKCETYAGFLKAEVSLINFAPLSEGKYVFGISDGNAVITFENGVFEGEADFSLERGFACLICFCLNGNVSPVAGAVCCCGEDLLVKIKLNLAEQENADAERREAEKREKENCGKENGETAFDDEAIAEVNYYELETDEGGRTVCEDKKEEENGLSGGEDEASACPVEEGNGLYVDRNSPENRNAICLNGAKESITDSEEEIFSDGCNRSDGGKENADGFSADDGNPVSHISDADRPADPGLAGGDFYGRMRGEIEKIFSAYPRIEELENMIEKSRWAKIGYGEGKHYAFGVIYSDGGAEYICYGVPSQNSAQPPHSLSGMASYIPLSVGGYWVMYQDAHTGVSIRISAE